MGFVGPEEDRAGTPPNTFGCSATRKCRNSHVSPHPPPRCATRVPPACVRNAAAVHSAHQASETKKIIEKNEKRHVSPHDCQQRKIEEQQKKKRLSANELAGRNGEEEFSCKSGFFCCCFLSCDQAKRETSVPSAREFRLDKRNQGKRLGACFKRESAPHGPKQCFVHISRPSSQRKVGRRENNQVSRSERRTWRENE